MLAGRLLHSQHSPLNTGVLICLRHGARTEPVRGPRGHCPPARSTDPKQLCQSTCCHPCALPHAVSHQGDQLAAHHLGLPARPLRRFLKIIGWQCSTRCRENRSGLPGWFFLDHIKVSRKWSIMNTNILDPVNSP